MDERRQEPPSTEHAEPNTETASQLPLWPPEEPFPVPVPHPSDRLARTLDPPWALADLGAFVLFAALSFFAANMIAGFVLSVLRAEFFRAMTMEEMGTAVNTHPFVVVFVQAGWELLWLVFIYRTITRKYRRPFWVAIKWEPGPHPRIAYLLGGMGLALLAEALFYMFPSEKQLPIERLFSGPESAYLLSVFGIGVAPFVEELVFRGFFYPVFERLWGLMAAVLITGALFACIHVPQLSGGWRGIGAIFVVGVVLSYCRGKTGSLLPPFLMHLAYNASLFVSLYISTDGFRSLKG